MIMEKVRVALEVLKKYHFWILLVLIVAITFGTWYMATGDRAEQFGKRKSAIEAQFGNMQKVSTTQNHPSEISVNAINFRVTGDTANVSEEVKKVSGINGFSDSLTGNVSTAAERLFDDQRKTFKLPIIYPNVPGDQARFAEDFWKVWNHKIEDIEKPPAEATNKEQYDLNSVFRLQYRDQIKEIFPELFKRIDLRTVVEGAAAGGEGRGQRSGAPDDQTKQVTGVVDWPGSEELIKRFQNWNEIPTTIQVMLAQEDLWVYEAVLNVIRNTNNCAQDKDKNYQPPASHKDAPIKKIEALEIGNDAAQSWAACENAVFVFSADSGGSAGTPTPTLGSAGMPASSRGQASYIGNAAAAATSGGSGGSTTSLLAGRYVDNDGKPLADPTQQPNQEFRMMPINLRVVMEQKAIPRLLVECANSNMRIDVREVRILKEKPPAFDVNGNSTGGDTAGGTTGPSMQAPVPSPEAASRRGMPGGRGRSGMGPSPGFAHPAQSSDTNSVEESVDPTAPAVPVEIQGVIYIYNPPTPQGANGTATAGAPTNGVAPAAPAAPGAVVPTSPAAPAAPATTPPATATPPTTGTAPAATPPGGAQPR
jgi:hypothetical protein